MRGGAGHDETDRGPWLRELNAVIRERADITVIACSAFARGYGSPHRDGRVRGRHEFADHRGAGDLPGHQQTTGGLGVGEKEQLVLADVRGTMLDVDVLRAADRTETYTRS